MSRPRSMCARFDCQLIGALYPCLSECHRNPHCMLDSRPEPIPARPSDNKEGAP